MAAEPLDLRHRQRGVLARNADRAVEAVVLLEPVGERPVVERAGERAGELVELGAARGLVDRVEDRRLDRPGVEQLLAHEVEVAAGDAAVRGPRVGAARERARPRGEVADRVGIAEPVAAVVAGPAARQEALEDRVRGEHVVHVRVDDRREPSPPGDVRQPLGLDRHRRLR